MDFDEAGQRERLAKTDGEVYELLRDRDTEVKWCCERWHSSIFMALRESDRRVWELVSKEFERRRDSIQLLAAENQCSKAVLAALGSVVQNKTAEGMVGGRLHGGCEVVDRIEQLAIVRAQEVFGARYANVQAHSGTQANQIVITAVLNAGDKILSLAAEHGGHFSHGSVDSFTGKFFEVENYYLDGRSCRLDYDAIRDKALEFRPRLIICGASAYPRAIDFKRFREIADEVGAYLLADISHISGLVCAGAHQSPIDFAHFTTTSTYKCGGPRGGLILIGKDFEELIDVEAKRVELWKVIEETTFPGVQGTPYFNSIAAKAVFFNEMLSEQYRQRQFGIIENAKRLAQSLFERGYDVVTEGTDNHMVILDIAKLGKGLTGQAVERVLGDCGIIVDRIKLPGDAMELNECFGIRLGTAIVTKMGMSPEQMDIIASIIDEVLRAVEIISPNEYKIDEHFKRQERQRVEQLCDKFSFDDVRLL